MESELDLIYKSIIFEIDIFGIFWCPLNVVKKRDFYDVLQENIECKIIINKVGKKWVLIQNYPIIVERGSKLHDCWFSDKWKFHLEWDWT